MDRSIPEPAIAPIPDLRLLTHSMFARTAKRLPDSGLTGISRCWAIVLLASAGLVTACHSERITTTEPAGVVQQFEIHEFYRLVAINGDTARVFPHDNNTGCPRAATTYQWSTLTFTPNVGQFVTFAATWHPLCQGGTPWAGTGQSVASYTQSGTAIAVMFSFTGTPVTGRFSATGDTVTLDDMPDVRGDPTWTNTARFTYIPCSAGACQ